jgi:hypothetical protein
VFLRFADFALGFFGMMLAVHAIAGTGTRSDGSAYRVIIK